MSQLTTQIPDLPTTPTAPATMRAAVLFGPDDIRVVERPTPRPGPDEVLVRVAMCGTCGTDLKILSGHFAQIPPYGTFTPGHEWAGTVVEVGNSVDEFSPGDRVCIEAHRGCGRCDNCLVGRYTACLNYARPEKGHRATGITADGGFAEYVVHHVSALYHLPDGVSFEDGVLITTAGTGLYGLDVARGYIVGQDVAIIGPGPVGLMTLQVCRQMGAGRIFLLGTRPSRLAVGDQLGADAIINVHETDPKEAVLGLTNGEGVDLAIEASGAPTTPQTCVEITKRGGKILFLAYYPERVSLDLSAVVRNDVTMYTSRGEGGNNVKRAVALARSGRLQGGPLVTHRFPLAEIREAFRVVKDRDGDPLKVVVVP